MLLKWDDKYSVKNYLIDEQHKRLFEIANMVDNMLKRQTNAMEIKKVLAALFEYMKTHFRDEEVYMESIQYPFLESHKEKHKQIVGEMVALVKDMQFDFKQKLVIIMEQWLLNHILQDDMGFADYLEDVNKKRTAQKSAKPVGTKSKDDDLLQQSVMETKKEKSAKKQKMHVYTCLCGKSYNIPPETHARIQAGDGVKCPDCTTFIRYVTDIEA